MPADGRAAVGLGLEALASRLDPIIATRLAPHLGGLEWNAILGELDKIKGRSPRVHDRHDLQSQLRVLTERLGGLGYPLDDSSRTVSRLGSELRVVRNRWAHLHPFDVLDTWRALDYAARLLEALGDDDGAASLARQRDPLWGKTQVDDATVDRAPEPAFELQAPPERLPLFEPAEIAGDGGSTEQAAEHETAPGEEAFARDDAARTPTVGQRRIEFEPWVIVQVGTPEVLDHLRRAASKEAVRAVIEEIVAFEGPVQIDRLAKLVARSFGVARLRRDKHRSIVHQIKASRLLVDGDGFVWPEDVERDDWREFRPSGPNDNRGIEEMSPVEVANAMRHLRAQQPSPIDDVNFDARVLSTFGRRRRTALATRLLAAARQRVDHFPRSEGTR
ncbi:DUF3320 domain-containing protein [Agrococcus sp. TSP3-2-1]|uniref:DUF3320 domain-containing protein n=1 Tax=Agrococcus sp. TSP3-2-1 TaxID=2804583 RepID=UPI003CEBDEF0